MIEFFLHQYAPSTIGRVALAAGAAGMAALALAVLAFVFDRAFGRFGDGVSVLTSVLTAGLSMLLFPEHYSREPQLAWMAFSLALLGSFLAAFGSVLAATGAASWFLAQLYVATGYGFLGIWLVILNISARAVNTFPHRAVSIGLLAGAVMALGITAIPGILGGGDSEASAPWLSRYVGRAGTLGWLVLYPLWCIWLGLLRLPH